jgi:hypothetical protein
MVNTAPPVPNMAQLRARAKAVRSFLWMTAKEIDHIFAGARVRAGALPWPARQEFLRTLENALAPYEALPKMLETEIENRERKIEIKPNDDQARQ